MPCTVKATVLPASNYVGKPSLIDTWRPLATQASPVLMLVTDRQLTAASTSAADGMVTNILPPAGMMFVVTN